MKFNSYDSAFQSLRKIVDGVSVCNRAGQHQSDRVV